MHCGHPKENTFTNRSLIRDAFMLPASQNVRPDRFATRESSCPDFQLFATNAVSCLAAGTSFLIAVIILSRRMAGGLTSQPSIPVLFLIALVGSGLIAAANSALSKCSPALQWLVKTTRFSVLVALVTLGIWLPLFTATTLVTIILMGALALLPSRRWHERDLSRAPSLPYWTVVAELGQTVQKNMLNLLRLEQAESNSSARGQDDTPPWWKFLRQGKQDAKQLVPLKNLSGEHAIFRPTTKYQSESGGTLLHWQERYELPDGTEHLRGQLMIGFAKGTRLTTGHVGFCPSFQSIPIVQVTTDYDALEVSVTAAEILPWGVRIECRVEEPIDEGTSIPVFLTVNKPLESSTS